MDVAGVLPAVERLTRDPDHRVEATGRLLIAAADVNVAAQRVLAERARSGIADAERLAEEVRAESDGG
jgi:hypothetical protein